ncbi:MAG: hypothetical protein H7144_18490 [Burkholderiales bacterium]|nr:hypothetical protein [Phycisphaerae bacterium]
MMIRTFAPLMIGFTLLLSSGATAQVAGPSTRPAPKTTRVTVKIANAPLPEAIQQFSDQTKLPLTLADGRQMIRFQGRRPGGFMPAAGASPANPANPAAAAALINIDAVDQPLMQVLAELLKQSGCVPAGEGQRMPGLALAPQAAVRIDLINERTLIVHQNISTNGNAQRQGSANYNYSFNGIILFDPSLNVIGAREYLSIESLEGVSEKLQPMHYGHQSLQRADGRQLAAFRFNVNFNLTSSISRITTMRGRIGAYQAVENRDIGLSGDDLLNGGKAEAGDLTLSVAPFDPGSPNGAQLILQGPFMKQYQQHPWNQSIGSFFRIAGPDGSAVPLRVDLAGSGDAQVTVRMAAMQGPINPADIDTIKLSLPTKIKELSIPFELRDVELP